MQIPEFVAKRITRPATYPEISDLSTPIPFFGNIETAKVATLSLNPSHNEFYFIGNTHKKERLRINKYKRLESLSSLEADVLESLTEAQVASVYKKCLCYFDESGNSYRGWFNRIDSILKESIGISYYDGTCCHTDIVQWATNPKWNGLPDSVAKQMLTEDLPFLKSLLLHYKLELVIMNGSTAVKKFREVFAANMGVCKEDEFGEGKNRTKFWCGDFMVDDRKLRFFGWNHYLQSASGTPEVRQIITSELRRFANNN